MLVDDNPADNFIHTRQILDMGLVPDNEAVFIKENGRAALEFFQNFDENKRLYNDRYPPKLVLLDINMPLMNGFEFLDQYEQLAKDPRYDSVVILMLTSSDNPTDKKRAAEYSCLKGYLTKPITQEKLREVVRTHF